MQHLINYNDYILQETINWFNNELLIINESKSTDKLINLWNNILSKAKKLNKKNKLKFYSYSLGALLSLFSYGQIKSVVQNDNEALEVLDTIKYDEDAINNTENIDAYFDKLKRNDTSEELIDDYNDNNKDESSYSTDYKNPLELKVSSKGRNKVKWHEGNPKKKGEPVLTAYRLGDGMITVGWGHAEKRRVSKFKVGQKITKEKAQELFKEDLQKASDGIRRIFQKWEEKGINVKLTQDQFDALVSITFNAGIGNVRMSDFIQSIKKNNFKKAGEQILKFKTSDKFSGLAERRKEEAKPFLDN